MFVQSLPARGIFTPRFILPNELSLYGLPDAKRQPNILSLVDASSALIDVHCGRLDGEGQGSLVYSTYAERLLMQARNRNITRLSFRPTVALTQTTIQQLTASANSINLNPSTGKAQTGNPLLNTNWFWTGVQANINSNVQLPFNTLSPIIGCSGRYGQTVRRSEYMVYPDLNYGINPLQLASFFGGPSGWTAINPANIDVDPATGEIWVPAGIYLSQYTEIVIVYNSGYHPLYLPPQIKQACAMLVRNFLSRGGGTTGLRGITTAGAVNVQFTPDLIDTTISRILAPFVSVIAY